MWARTLFVLGVITAHVSAQYSTGWNFSWPTSTQQCQNVTVGITGGKGPWVVGLIPLGGAPVVWTVQPDPDGAPNYTNPLEAKIPIQFPAGTFYTVMVTDTIGYAGGSRDVLNPRPLQRVRESTNADCLSSIRTVAQEFTFDITGSVSQCSDTFTFNWLDQVGKSPYSFTVVPLDTSYSPWDVRLKGGAVTPGEGWRVNMTEGTRFTIIMSNDNGWGRGGVGALYEVRSGSTNSCISQTYLGQTESENNKDTLNLVSARTIPCSRSSSLWILQSAENAAELDFCLGRLWPIGSIVTATVLPTDLSYTTTIIAQTSAPRSSNVISSVTRGSSTQDYSVLTRESAIPTGDTSGQKSNTSIGAIAGGAAGGALAVILVGLLVFFLLRRKRRSRESRGYAGGDLDGGGGTAGMGTVEPKLEPYHPVPTSPGLTPGLPYQDYTTVQHGNTVTALPSSNSPYSAYTDSLPLAWPEPVPIGTTTTRPASMPQSHSHPSATSDTSTSGLDHLDRPNPGFGVLCHSASRDSLTTNPARASYFDQTPIVPAKSASPPTFTSSRTETGPSQASGRVLDTPSWSRRYIAPDFPRVQSTVKPPTRGV